MSLYDMLSLLQAPLTIKNAFLGLAWYKAEYYLEYWNKLGRILRKVSIPIFVESLKLNEGGPKVLSNDWKCVRESYLRKCVASSQYKYDRLEKNLPKNVTYSWTIIIARQ